MIINKKMPVLGTTPRAGKEKTQHNDYRIVTTAPSQASNWDVLAEAPAEAFAVNWIVARSGVNIATARTYADLHFGGAA